MKVLLLGDFSTLHLTLAQGLKHFNIDVKVASNGDFWKNIARDIDLKQTKSLKRITFPLKLIKQLPHLLGFDIVQLVSPNFLMSSPQLSSLYFELIKHHNGKFFMCASGMEYTCIKYALEKKLKHSVFYHPELQPDPFINDQISLLNNHPFKKLETKIAHYCNGIIATANDYYHPFKDRYPDKTHFIPLPINTQKFSFVNSINNKTKKIRFFVGLMKDRIKFKGTDVIIRVLKRLENKYPQDMELIIVNSVPYNEYKNLLDSSHILCDQRYVYGIGMNGLLAMSKGLIVGGGADDELYEFLGEYKNKPIIDLNSSEEQMFEIFESLIKHKDKLKEQAINSRKFVVDHYDYIKVAKQYLDFWNSK